MAAFPQGQTYVDPPTLVPLEGGLFGAAEVKPFGSPHEAFGVIYESEACAPGNLVDMTAATCIATAAQETDGFHFVTGGPLNIYAGVACNLFGGYERAKPAALRRLNASAQRLVERSLWEKIFPSASNGTVDLTPAGGAVKPKIGLGLLEEYAGSHYDAVPIIHAGKRASVFLASEGVVSFDADKAKIAGGALFANGQGYTNLSGPGNVVAGTNEVWVYATGAIVIRHGDIRELEAVAPQTNDLVAYAQETYVPTIDCFTAAIRVKLE